MRRLLHNVNPQLDMFIFTIYIALLKEELKQKKLELPQKLAESRGFDRKISAGANNNKNIFSCKKRSPATDKMCKRAVSNWRI